LPLFSIARARVSADFRLFLPFIDRVTSGHAGRRSSTGSSVRGALVAMLLAMAPSTSKAPLTSFTQLGVSLETYRTWDSGRRPARPDLLTRANALARRCDPHALRPLETLARLIHVHVKTRHAAAKDGRLRVTYETRTTFRSVRARATVADADTFLHAYFEKAVWPKDRPAPLSWSQIPSDYDDQIRRVRRRRGLTQAQFATWVGAACKAVVYQWESRTRTPSPVLWQRVEALGGARLDPRRALISSTGPGEALVGSSLNGPI
jgi:ribosome-binding protein aMBF1 (putative translation factor)